MNGTCQVIVGTKMCGWPAVGSLTGKTHGSAGQPSKTISTMVCEVHAKEMENAGESYGGTLLEVRPKCRARHQALRLDRAAERSDNCPRQDKKQSVGGLNARDCQTIAN